MSFGNNNFLFNLI